MTYLDVDELDGALAVRVLGVVEDPDVGRDAGVEKHVGRQGDDRLDEVVLQEVAADLGRSGASGAVEEWGAVHDDPHPTTAVLGVAHLVGEVEQEEHLPVGGRWQARGEAAVGAGLVALVLDGLGVLLPVHAVGRVGHAEVELTVREGVVREGVAEGDVGGVVALGEHVRLADRVGLRVVLLPEET